MSSFAFLIKFIAVKIYSNSTFVFREENEANLMEGFNIFFWVTKSGSQITSMKLAICYRKCVLGRREKMGTEEGVAGGV